MPKVSIILPTYNRAHLIGRSIESVLHQDFTDFELIIVNDGSTDGTEEVVGGFGDGRIKYLKNDGNRGCSFSRNCAISRSSGEYIGFLDSGDEWLPGKLGKQVNILDKQPADIVYTSQLLIENGSAKLIKPAVIMPDDGIVYAQALDNKVRNINIQTALIRKGCFALAGGFDENMHRWSDFEFLIRLSKHARFYYLDESTIKWYDGDGNITANRGSLTSARKIIVSKFYKDFLLFDKKEALADHLYSIGHALCLKGEFKEGRKYLFDAVKVCPRFIKASTALPASFFGRVIYNKIHRF